MRIPLGRVALELAREEERLQRRLEVQVERRRRALLGGRVRGDCACRRRRRRCAAARRRHHRGREGKEEKELGSFLTLPLSLSLFAFL